MPLGGIGTSSAEGLGRGLSGLRTGGSWGCNAVGFRVLVSGVSGFSNVDP